MTHKKILIYLADYVDNILINIKEHSINMNGYLGKLIIKKFNKFNIIINGNYISTFYCKCSLRCSEMWIGEILDLKFNMVREYRLDNYI